MFSVQNHLIDGRDAHYYEKQNSELLFHSLEEGLNESGKKVLQTVPGEFHFFYRNDDSHF